MPSNQNEDQTRIYRPNTFQMPNALVDKWLTELTGSEFKVATYICRHTYGWHKEADGISLSQMMQGVRKHDGTFLDRGTGIRSKETLLTALTNLEKKGLILRERRRSVERGDEPTVYRLMVTDGEGEPQPTTGSLDQKTRPPVGGKSDQGGGPVIRPGGWAENPTTQNPSIQNPSIQNPLTSKGNISQNRNHDASRFSKKQVSNQQNNASDNLDDPDARPRRAAQSSLKPVGELISHRQAVAYAAVSPPAEQPAPRRRKAAPAATPQIEHLLTDFSGEFHDEEHTAQNISQAARLWKESGRSESVFCQLVYEARALTKQYRVKKRAQGPGGEMGLRNKMPYFFSVLKDLLGMKPQPPGTAPQAPPG